MMTPILPMLATSAQPFNAYDHLFEIKWDGVRTLACVEEGRWRLWGRELVDYTDRYPEMAALRRLPSGTMLDGELVLFRDGRPDLSALLQRHQLSNPARIRHASRRTPVHYILFDILYHRGRSLLEEPLFRRRRVLVDAFLELKESTPELIFSEGIVGEGEEFFERVVALGYEGVMAKQQTSRYTPGRRSPAWKKIKPARTLPCAIVGYRSSRQGLHSVLVATTHEGPLRYVAEVASGFTDEMKRLLGGRLVHSRRSCPVVACPRRAVWVEPDVFCQVQFLEWTRHGHLRHPSFKGLLEEKSGTHAFHAG